MNKQMKQHLEAVVGALVEQDTAAAKAAFHDYLRLKSQSILLGESDDEDKDDEKEDKSDDKKDDDKEDKKDDEKKSDDKKDDDKPAFLKKDKKDDKDEEDCEM